ncbi:HNH endonuclease signature motif containing protein [Blastococcus saxobsidens]|uniref:HNH endonuclease n=1 Tax=Blastococcus saxobsidens (strain DD2) TaxID=1146883 RepID=H6RJY8_BLASD|nr:HNH endonuclease signature motif containing protein [Blastococcus saxobsidens]CCG04844.1 HNH endonuclease [Blastococcus saxobsidens DD2]
MSGSSTVEGVLIDWSLDQPIAPSRLPVALLSREQAAAELAQHQRRQAMAAAYEAELILRLAELTSDEHDPPAGTRGARRPGWVAGHDPAGVSEFFAGELALVLNRGRGTANHRHHRAQVWRDSLPATYRALSRGELDEARAAALADVLGHTSPELARAVEDLLLPDAVDLSVAKLKARALELLLELDAAAAEERREQAKRCADVFLQPGQDGMATLGAELSADEAAEAYAVINELATMAKADGDDRPIAQIRTELFSLLLRRPGGHDQPDVAADLRITATLESLQGAATQAGSVNGLAITAAHARDLLARIGALGLQTPPGGSLTFAITDADGRLLATTTVTELLRVAKNGCAEHPGESCGCPVIGSPPDSDGYEPTSRQEAFVTTRDRTCRMPNCGQRVGWADLDHVIPHSRGGATTCANLCCLCRSDHRLKTFARGWRFIMDPDGTLHVTTPTGITRTTRPPGLRRPQSEPPPEPKREPPPAEPDGEPPPF